MEKKVETTGFCFTWTTPCQGLAWISTFLGQIYMWNTSPWSLTFSLFCFLTSDQIPILFSVVLIILLFGFFLCIFTSAFSWSKFLFYISMSFYCILETLSTIASIPCVSSLFKKYFISWNNYHLCITLYIVLGTFYSILLGMLLYSGVLPLWDQHDQNFSSFLSTVHEEKPGIFLSQPHLIKNSFLLAICNDNFLEVFLLKNLKIH